MGNRAAVDGLWHESSTVAADRASVYAFSVRDGRTTVLFGAQDAPNQAMGEYVPAYLRGTAPVMTLTPPAQAEQGGATVEVR